MGTEGREKGGKMEKKVIKRLLIAIIFLFIISIQSIYAMDSISSEVMEELSVYITNKAESPVYIQYYIGPSWDSSDSKGSQLVPASAVNLLAKEGVTCYAEIGSEGVSKNQRNLITVNVYDNALPERKLLSTQTAKNYIYVDKDITRDKGNYWIVHISKDYQVKELRRVQLYTGRTDTSTNLGRAAMHYRLIRVRTAQGALLIGLVSLILFIKSMKNGVMIVGSKINKLGLLFLLINSLIVITFCAIDTVDAIETSSSGFALIPVMMIDFPAIFIAFPVASLLSNLVSSPLTNDAYIQYTIVTKSILAISILIFGGLQWYSIGWLISKLIRKFSPAPK